MSYMVDSMNLNQSLGIQMDYTMVDLYFDFTLHELITQINYGCIGNVHYVSFLRHMLRFENINICIALSIK